MFLGAKSCHTSGRKLLLSAVLIYAQNPENKQTLSRCIKYVHAYGCIDFVEGQGALVNAALTAVSSNNSVRKIVPHERCIRDNKIAWVDFSNFADDQDALGLASSMCFCHARLYC